MINETRLLDRLLGLEQAFTVVYRDQRRYGRSLCRPQAQAGISLEQMAGDTVSLLEFLQDRFGGKTYLAGFSSGATPGARPGAQNISSGSRATAMLPDDQSMHIDGSARGYLADLSRCQHSGHHGRVR
jgi:pimeloyl-ACP methyl ester carboxylesterase